MKLKIGKIIAAFLVLLSAFPLFSESASFQSENYTINVKYNNVVSPGHAVFVRMNVIPAKNIKKQANGLKAELQLLNLGKKLETSPFYQINPKKNRNSWEMLSGVPVTIWNDSEQPYQVKVVFSLNGEKPQEFILPTVFKPYAFEKEDIPLNQANTDIRTDTSAERMAQIEKLNNIFFSTSYQAVYQTKPFTSPTDSTRYTARCGDRRTFIYANGKKSTTLHFGNDYGIPTGSEVKACAEGKVLLAENRISTGWSIVIEHLPGLYSVYYHLSELSVNEGDMVKQGQLIGKSGATGLATGPHLHWEMRLNGSAIVPEFFLRDFTFETE